MADSFSLTENRLINSLLSKRSAEYIAMLLDRPQDQVEKRIYEISGTYRKSYDQKKAEKKRVVEAKKKLKATNNLLAKRSLKKARKIELKKVPEKVFVTRKIDLSKKMSVRIDHRTIIYVDKGSDIVEVIRKYKERDPSFKKPENPNKVVKKFK